VVDVRPIPFWRYPAEAGRFDSAPGIDSPYSRWSYRLGPPRQILRCRRAAGGATLWSVDRELRDEVTHWDDPLEALRWIGEQASDHLSGIAGPPFKGGWAGFIGYDTGGLFEKLPATARDDLDVPLFEFHRIDSLDACDAAGRIFAIDVTREVARASVVWREPLSEDQSQLASNFTSEQYMQAVARVIEYIRAGDVFQVNLSQRFAVGLGARNPGEIYQRLLKNHPAWYGAFFQSDDFALLCNSPELFLGVKPGPTGRRIITRPIKGTRPLGNGMREELAASVKDQAELNMIVDLERNDLGRVCEVGSIHVTEPRVIERHPTVYHGAAAIEGKLRADVGFVDLLRATFPGGSVTGAPKIRAMQIIDELEPVRRGPYCGAIGYLSVDGHMEFNVAIRTMTIERGRVHIPVGGGIVADSDPRAEYEETLVKAMAMFAALGISEGNARSIATDEKSDAHR
jgi:para-aminobenzoate synthetase component 1